MYLTIALPSIKLHKGRTNTEPDQTPLDPSVPAPSKDKPRRRSARGNTVSVSHPELVKGSLRQEDVPITEASPTLGTPAASEASDDMSVSSSRRPRRFKPIARISKIASRAKADYNRTLAATAYRSDRFLDRHPTWRIRMANHSVLKAFYGAGLRTGGIIRAVAYLLPLALEAGVLALTGLVAGVVLALGYTLTRLIEALAQTKDRYAKVPTVA